MKVYALSDLHLSFSTDKPMDVFGEKWENYESKIKENWNNKVKDDDCVIIAGDISWAMQISETKEDFKFIGELCGKKIIVRGNHDYWWKAISTVRNSLPYNTFALQNDAIKIEDTIFCGTRGWITPEDNKSLSTEDQKIYDRELIRLSMAIDSAKKLQTNNEEIICILHYPPFNSTLTNNKFLDLIYSSGIKKVVFGHLHGKTKYSEKQITLNGVDFILSSCDKIGFDPVLVKD